jgi:hypothetical protein
MEVDPTTIGRVSYVPDQVILNVLVYTQEFEHQSIPIHIYGEREAFHCMWYHFNRRRVRYILGDYTVMRNGRFPLCLHMFDRSPHFTMSVQDACPQEFPMPDLYVRLGQCRHEGIWIW